MPTFSLRRLLQFLQGMVHVVSSFLLLFLPLRGRYVSSSPSESGLSLSLFLSLVERFVKSTVDPPRARVLGFQNMRLSRHAGRQPGQIVAFSVTRVDSDCGRLDAGRLGILLLCDIGRFLCMLVVVLMPRSEKSVCF